MRQRAWLVVLMLITALFLVAAAGKATFSDDTYSVDELATPAPEESPAPETVPVTITITAAGDVTLGGNMLGSGSNMYTKALAARGGDLAYFFANVQPYFGTDDLTIVNFEGTLTNRTEYRGGNEYRFRAPPEHVQMLPLGSVEAVALDNNHVMDYYESGLDDTVEALTGAGIVYASEGRPGVYQVKGVTVGMLAYKTFDGHYPHLMEQVPKDIEALRASCDVVIVSFHWGDEAKYKPNDNQVKLGRATIDAGADLVLGHHSHRVAPIECYKDKYIVYSLGNCVFSGNSKPSDMDTFLFQQQFTVANGQVSIGPFRVIPASISSVTGLAGSESDTNDLAVTPFEAGSKAAKRVIDKMLSNGKDLDYAVKAYPTEWPGGADPAVTQPETPADAPEIPEESDETSGVYL